MQTKEAALKKIKSLVERFEEQKEFYKRSEYNETQTRRDFIDPFFEALGWDVDNKNGYAESYREVIHEDRVKVGGATKAPDYSFRLPGGKRLFFLEAKKPSVTIKDDSQPAYQIRRYGWSAKMPISVITDFEEFAIYDCTQKPKPTDKASVARIKYITYAEYAEEFDFLWDTFSKERVLKGSFDKYIQSDKNKKGTTTVDHDFLQSLDKWRVELARNIALRNKDIVVKTHYDASLLNFLVQNTIDRIIFLRIAEDRNVEPYGNLQETIKNGDYYQNLLQRFQVADQKYNSGLFDFRKDKISSRISIDNKVIKSIISELYYPICPYEFSVLSVEILGSAYEQFLGKQITLSKGGRATIEEKPEVRKAGGVYYTPQYIVDYIVENTVGRLLCRDAMHCVFTPEDAQLCVSTTPEDVAKIKICDPACGSGSFLIGAYQYLLNWHKDYYTASPLSPLQKRGEKKDAGTGSSHLLRKGLRGEVLTPQGELTTAEKKRILLNNIYGVDLDSNAVEVTKLSLLLKCMEGETKESIEAQQKLFHDRILPSLDNNIKSGNSLIDLDYYDNELDFGEERKIKPFSWEKNFPEVFRQGGFDCVIGNPPYVSVKEINTNHKNYFIEKYEVATGQFDLYTLFIEKSFQILNSKGIFGMITSNTFLANKDCLKLRSLLVNQHHIIEIANLGETVFKDANLDVAILISSKNTSKEKTKIIIDDNGFKEGIFHLVDQINWKRKDDFPFTIKIKEEDYELLNKLFKDKESLKNFVELPRGIEVGSNSELITSEPQIGYLPVLFGKSIKQYQINFNNQYIRFDYNNKSTFKDINIYQQEKILIQRIRNLSLKQRIVATLDTENYVCTNTLRIGIPKQKTTNLRFLLGILNSKLVNWIFLKEFMNKDIYSYQLEQIPIPSANIEQIDLIAKFVDQLLQLNKELQMATLPEKIEQIQARISYNEDRINEVVYALYGLGEEERGIIEGK